MRRAIADVPEEIWEQIVSNLVEDRHLGTLSLVSKSFLSITNRQKRNLKIFKPTIHFLPNLLRRFPNLRRISLARCISDANLILAQLASFQLPIEKLDLSNLAGEEARFPAEGIEALPSATRRSVRSLILKSMLSLSDEDLMLIADSFPNLEELDLSEPQIWEDQGVVITDEGMDVLASKLPGLRRIDLHGNFLISDKSVVTLSEKCTNLEAIVVRECNFVTQVGISHALLGSKNLKSLVLRGMDIAGNEISASLHYATNLCEIDLSFMTVSDAFMYAVIKAKLPCLRKFSLFHCQGFGFPGLMAFLRAYQLLDHLALEGVYFITDTRMINLSQFLGNAKTLKLNYCDKLSNYTFLRLVKFCPKLETLEMERTNLGICDNFVVNNAFNSQVRVLNLSLNKHLSNDFLETVSLSCPNVEVLEMINCSAVTKKGVGVIMRNMRALRHVKISGCMNVRGLVFSMQQPQLNLEIFEAHATHIHDETLISVAKCFPELKVLDVKDCNDITTRGVKEVVDKCVKLKEINMNGCRNMTPDLVHWMVFSRPSLRKINVPLGGVYTDLEKNFFLRHGCYLSMDGDSVF